MHMCVVDGDTDDNASYCIIDYTCISSHICTLQHQYICTYIAIILIPDTDANFSVCCILYTEAVWPLLYVNVCRCVYKPLQFFKQAGIPGPKPKPFIGNLDLFLKFGVSIGSAVPCLSDLCCTYRCLIYCLKWYKVCMM